ncbi:MAG: hypothetical protein OEM49_09630 [Myxococcales bacterium]|nr:hypothetical protein [Myxococcales bacterium]MDH5308005.1 hypothetical protein [Myxococcales bacterium]MDH5567876.1 hypothetical protein [Myxococcales bacterium]
MQRDYEMRMHKLEERVQAAEQRAEQAAAQTADGVETAPAADAQSEDATLMQRASDAWAGVSRAFNPSISAILQGRLAYLQGGEGERWLSGFPLGGMTDRGHEGISLGESEVVFSANVDDKLYGFLDVSFDQDEIGVEEAYFSTLSLPFGLGLKGGQFLSAIGYHNDRHPHTWDFVDAPLVYEAMLDTSLSDAGVQLSWVAPTDLYFEIGGEALRGDAFPAAGAANRGFGSGTVFAKLAGDVGESSSWKAGLSYLRADSNGRESEAPDASPVFFDGSTDLVIADLVWKWAPLGNFHERNFTFQTEYMHRQDRGDVTAGAGPGRYRSGQDGFYAQGVYQFMPRWRVGLRYGQLWGDYDLEGLAPGVLAGDGSSPRRVSTMLDFSNSEFSRFRLQYSFESGGLGDDSLVYLQYILSIGSHGAHAF